MAALDRLSAGLLPAPGGQGDAEGAGVPAGHPGKFRPVPDGAVQVFSLSFAFRIDFPGEKDYDREKNIIIWEVST